MWSNQKDLGHFHKNLVCSAYPMNFHDRPAAFASAAGRPLLAFLSLLMLAALPASAQSVAPLWKEGAPGPAHVQPETSEDKRETGRLDRWLSYVDEPTLTFYPAPADKATGATVMVIPGGGYRYVCIDKEGIEPAQWLNSIGLHAVVLKYRSIDPKIDRTTKSIITYFDDPSRAMRVLRSQASEWGINPAKVGVMGFSAGAVMSLHLLAQADAGEPTSSDPVARFSNRPDFVIFIYGAPPPGKAKPAPKNSPPVLIVHASDDPKAKVAGAKRVQQWLTESGVPVETRIYKSGGHGFGMTPKEGDVREWTNHCAQWLRSIGML